MPGSQANRKEPNYFLLADHPPGTCRARTCSAFVFPTEVSGLRGRKDEDGFLFRNRCAVRRSTFMKEGALQSSTARHFGGGSFRFAETGAG